MANHKASKSFPDIATTKIKAAFAYTRDFRCAVISNQKHKADTRELRGNFKNNNNTKRTTTQQRKEVKRRQADQTKEKEKKGKIGRRIKVSLFYKVSEFFIFC